MEARRTRGRGERKAKGRTGRRRREGEKKGEGCRTVALQALVRGGEGRLRTWKQEGGEGEKGKPSCGERGGKEGREGKDAVLRRLRRVSQ